jgi:hypothetical protein
MNAPTPNRFRTKKFQAAKKKLVALDKQRGGHEYIYAKELEGLEALCTNRQEFRRFLQDPADGLGYTNGTVISAREKVDALAVVPEQKIWEAIGWAGGVRQIWSIPKHEERKKLHKEVRKRVSRGRLSKTAFKDLLKEHAPSLKIRKSAKRDEALAARLKELEKENEMWKRWIRDTSKKIPILKELLTDEQRELLAN